MDKDVQDRMAKRKSRFAEVAAATGQKPAGAVGNEIAEPRVCASMMAQTASDIFFVFQATQFAEAPTAAQVATLPTVLLVASGFVDHEAHDEVPNLDRGAAEVSNGAAHCEHNETFDILTETSYMFIRKITDPYVRNIANGKIP
eukprot:TRINITY_DN2041_c0_g1_i6.p1 TRINITY_DN2041_c0_g1~~TRINITY_DN2041_c0_g1_i6.p1  ORF type:complete len:144 (+),score=11.53 TRINITY_DN2041_c0_g1_i6:258-689(+)